MTPLDGYSGCFLFLRRRWNSTTLTHAHCVSVTSSPELFFPCLPLCSKVGMRPGVARRRFDAAIRKRKVLDNFWQSVHDRGIEVVIYGSAHIEPNGKGEPNRVGARRCKDREAACASDRNTRIQHNKAVRRLELRRRSQGAMSESHK